MAAGPHGASQSLFMAVPPAVMAATEGAAALPSLNLGAAPAPLASPASMSSKMSQLTNSNCGLRTVSNSVDPDLALSAQFFLTRSYAVGTGENLLVKVLGTAPARVHSQCDALGPVMEPMSTA